MKSFILLIFCCSLSFSSYSQTESIRAFYHKYKKSENTFNMKAPGWLIRLGATFVRMGMDDPEEKRLLKFMAKRVRKARILVMEDDNHVSKREFRDLLSSVREEEFEDLVEIREDEQRVNVLARIDGETIEDLLVFVQENNEFVMLAMKTKIKAKHLSRLIEMALSNEDLSFN